MSAATDSRRVLRMAGQLREELSRIFLEDTQNPLLTSITLTEVELTRDLKIATIRFSTPATGKPLKEVEKALQKSTSFFRRKLSEAMELRFVPELRFRFDDQPESINRLMHLFEEIRPTHG